MIEFVVIAFVKTFAVLFLLALMLPFAWNIENKALLALQKRKYKFNLGFYADVVKSAIKSNFRSNDLSQYVSSLIRMFFLLLCLTVIPLCEPFYYKTFKIYSEIISMDYAMLFAFLFLLLSFYGKYISLTFSRKLKDKIGFIKEASGHISIILCSLFIFLTIYLVYGSADFHMIIQSQSALFFYKKIPTWGMFTQPVSAFLFLYIIFRINLSYKAMSETKSSTEENFLEVINKPLLIISLSFLYSFLFLGGYNILPGLNYFSSKFLEAHYFFQTISLLIKATLLMTVISVLSASLNRSKSEIVMKFLNDKILIISILNFVFHCGYIYITGVI